MTDMYPHELKTLIDSVESHIKKLGFHQQDRRLNRQTTSVVGYTLDIDDGNILRYLKSTKPLSKFDADWGRLALWFSSVITAAAEDKDSRRLVLYNTPTQSMTDYPCFTQMQVCRDDESYTLVVTQRSGDVAKMKDDLAFFGSVAHKFENKLKIKIRKICVMYAHIHCVV